MGLAALLVVLIAGGSGYEAFSRHRAATQFPPTGQIIDIGDRSIHLDCRGTGTPTVVFESGLGVPGSLDWDLVHNQIAASTRACTYDRASGLTREEYDAAEDVSKALRAEQASWSTRGRLVLVPGSGHYIHFDRPDVGIAAVNDVVASVRNSSEPFGTTTTTE